jgi:hypothetical protein
MSIHNYYENDMYIMRDAWYAALHQQNERKTKTLKGWFESYFGFPLNSKEGASELVCCSAAFEKCWNTAIETLQQSEKDAPNAKLRGAADET